MADTAVKQLTAAYESIMKFSRQGQHPEEYLTYEFLCKNPILLQPGILRIDWNRYTGFNPADRHHSNCSSSGQSVGPLADRLEGFMGTG